MARICYRPTNFRSDRLARIVQINKILAEYTSQRVSVRQLYYRLVAADLIPNQQSEYDKIQNLVTDARYAGLIDWNAIEDRNREPVKREDWKNGPAALADVVEKFRLDRWEGQPFYIELWVEKAALAGVLWPIAEDYHITLFPTRGYNSASAMKEAAQRIIHRGRDRRSVVLYVGDHDPSGEDMVRDVRDRLAEFGCPPHMDVRKIALTMAQIEEYKPPPNRLKRKDDPQRYKNADTSLADSRAAAYAEVHGEESWEVDSLPPKVLDLLVRTTINAYVDKKMMEQVIAKEKLIKGRIKKFAAGFKDV